MERLTIKAAGTLAENDLFDWLEVIKKLSKYNTQKEIGEKIGWSRSKVADHNKLLNIIVAKVLEKAKRYQKGRATGVVANATNFTEGWFRTSGIYELIEATESKNKQLVDEAVNTITEKMEAQNKQLEQQNEMIKKLSDQVNQLQQENNKSLLEKIKNFFK